MTVTFSQMIDAVRDPVSLGKRTPQSREFAANFCSSILVALSRYGSLTARQEELLGKLYKEATTEPEVYDMSGISGIRDLFEKASKRGLKRPSITVSVDDCEIELSRAPDHGVNRGAIYVKGNGEYLGKIVGVDFSPRHNAQPFIPGLLKFANDPAGVAAASGHLTGRCSFCNRKLTDERSLFVGYGSTCADNYDLPWGDVA